jgi:NitT/TauT family transport system substrate-binding protein
MDQKDGRSAWRLSRRQALIAGTGAGAALVGGLVVRNQVRHHGTHHKVLPDGRFRRLVLSWPSSNMLVFAVARARFFRDYNLDVALVDGPRTGRGTIADMVAGRAVGAVSPILTWLDVVRLGGVPAHLVSGLQSGTFRLLVRRKVKITRLDGIAGLRIAVMDQDMADRLFFSVMMRRKGIDPETAVKWVTMPPERAVDAARAGDIDAVAAHDPLAWQLLHGPDSPFFELTNSTTGHYGERANLALGLSDSFLQSDPAAAAALVMALRAAADWIKAHPDQAAGVMTGQIAGMDTRDILSMLRHETLGICPVGADLRVQVAQYVDEMKLLGRVPDTVGSAAYARRICANALETKAPTTLWPQAAGPT